MDASGVFGLAISYIGYATKGAQSIVALFESLTSSKSSIQNFVRMFKNREKKNIIDKIELTNLLELEYDSILEIKQVNGVLAPIMDFIGEEATNYKEVSHLIKSDLSKVIIQSSENEFIAINSKEWYSYGCSLQSTTDHGTQIMSLVETEEVNRIAVIVSNKYYKEKLKSSTIDFGINSSISGLLVPLNSQIISAIIGDDKMERLKLSGHKSVLIPDESLINKFDVDFSFNPDIYFNSQKCFFLGYLWVIYTNIRTGEMIPIYEYGNIADKNSFIILSEKLIHQIEFFKKRIWKELERPSEDRMYHLLISFNDNLTERIRSYFQEVDYFSDREKILALNKEDIINALH